jgi:hypothetical protein
MSQAQYLMIILGVIVVGIAVMHGVRGYNEGRKKANLDALAQDAYEIAVDGIRWMRKPEFFGGGGDNCLTGSCDWSSATLEGFGYGSEDDGNYHSYHGIIELDPVSNPSELVVRGTNDEMGNEVVIRVRGPHIDSVYTVVNPMYAP